MRGDHRQVVRPVASWSLKPRTYREKARKAYLNTAKKKKKTRAELKVAIGKQLRYVNRDLKTIDRLLCAFFGKSIEGEGTHLCLDDPQGAGTADLYAEKQDPQLG
jgi:hypothetical protein